MTKISCFFLVLRKLKWLNSNRQKVFSMLKQQLNYLVQKCELIQGALVYLSSLRRYLKVTHVNYDGLPINLCMVLYLSTIFICVKMNSNTLVVGKV